MKIRVFSDLHLDKTGWEVPQVPADLTVIPGDLFDDGMRSMEWCADWAQRSGAGVVFVPGNHEFWDSVYSRRLLQMSRFARRHGIHLLHNRSVVIDGVRFAGGPLWSDFNAGGAGIRPMAMHAAYDRLPDFQYILCGGEDPDRNRFTPERAVKANERAVRALNTALVDAYDEPVVVVTHHAPSLHSVSDRFKAELVHVAYANDFDDYVETSFAKVWMHGHIHSSVSRRFGDTQLICNPRGSGNFINPDFDPELVIEV